MRLPRIDAAGWRWLAGALSLCGAFACTSFARLDDTPSLAERSTPEPTSGDTGGARSVSPNPGGPARTGAPTPGNTSEGTPVDALDRTASTAEGAPSTPSDAGRPPEPPDPGVEADAGTRDVDAPVPVEVPVCLGSALELDGESFAVVPRRVEDDFTLEAWFKTSGAQSGARSYEGRALFDSDVIGADSDFLSTIADDRAAFGIGGSADVGVRGSEIVTTDEWVHVALTRNASNGQLQIFVNGALDAVTIGTNFDALNGQPNLAFGGAATSRHFIGSIDEVRVWNVVRSAEEIATNLRERLSGSEAGLVGYYDFEDRGLEQTADGSPLGIAATLVGNPTYVTSTARCPPVTAAP